MVVVVSVVVVVVVAMKVVVVVVAMKVVVVVVAMKVVVVVVAMKVVIAKAFVVAAECSIRYLYSSSICTSTISAIGSLHSLII